MPAVVHLGAGRRQHHQHHAVHGHRRRRAVQQRLQPGAPRHTGARGCAAASQEAFGIVRWALQGAAFQEACAYHALGPSGGGLPGAFCIMRWGWRPSLAFACHMHTHAHTHTHVRPFRGGCACRQGVHASYHARPHTHVRPLQGSKHLPRGRGTPLAPCTHASTHAHQAQTSTGGCGHPLKTSGTARETQAPRRRPPPQALCKPPQGGTLTSAKEVSAARLCTPARLHSVVPQVASLVVMAFMLFGGFLLNKERVPVYCRWVSDFSFFNYAYEVRRGRVDPWCACPCALFGHRGAAGAPATGAFDARCVRVRGGMVGGGSRHLWFRTASGGVVGASSLALRGQEGAERHILAALAARERGDGLRRRWW